MKEGILSPQQIQFLSHYTNPESETFSNAYRSALKANYSEEYAQNITGQLPDWLSESISDIKMLKKAERNLDKALDIDINNKEIGDRSLKATLFVAERLGKKKYSQKYDLEGSVTLKKIIIADE